MREAEAAAQNINQIAGETIEQGNVQVIQATYTSLGDISPNRFTVNAKQPVRFEIEAKKMGKDAWGV